MKIAMLINNTGQDIRDFESAIKESFEETGSVPEELADIFEAKLIVVDGENRLIVDWK